MKIALIALAALLPALASAKDPAPYVLHDGRAAQSRGVSRGISAAARNSGPAARSTRSGFTARPSAAGQRSFHGAGGSSRRGIMGAAPTGAGGTGAPTTGATNATSPSSAIGAKVLTLGQQPVYSVAAGGGTSSVNGGGFITIDQSRANDVGRTPGITYGPRDTPPSSGRGSGGTGASANGPAPGSVAAAAAPATAPSANRGSQSATGFDPSF